MSIYVILGTPGAFDFEALGESTRRTLALLAPLVELQQSKSKIAQEILAQVREFVKAIKLGVEAAQRGFTAAEDILTLTRLVHSTTLEERTEYLVGTLELADQAYSKGQEAFQVFRDVRTKIFSLTDRFNAMATNASTSTFSQDRRSVEELRKSIGVLEEFGNQISAMVQWWDWVKIETRVERDARSTVSFDDSSLRQKSVVDRWKLLRTQFADYTNMVGQLEDSYPELLSPQPTARRDWEPSQSQVPKRIMYRRHDIQQALRISRKNSIASRASGCMCIVA